MFYSESNFERRVECMTKNKKYILVILIIAIIICAIVTIFFLTNSKKHEAMNYIEEIYSYNNALLGDAPKMKSLVSMIPLKEDIEISTIELDTETNNTSEMGIYINTTNSSNITDLSVADVYEHAGIFLSLVKNADFVQYNYINGNDEVASIKLDRESFEGDLNEYAESYERFKMFIENKECRLNDVLSENEKIDVTKKDKYISILKEIYNEHKLPDGSELGYDGGSDFAENKFAIYDIDFDGSEELIISYTTSYMAGMMALVYDFDSNLDTLTEELVEFPALTFYNNGIVKADASHNQGLAGEALWPYSLYKYDGELDKYILVAIVDAWDKSCNDTNYLGTKFPEDIDKDGDGIVYYIMTDGEYELNTPVDLEEYNKWINSYLNEAEEISIPFMSFTDENIDSIK